MSRSASIIIFGLIVISAFFWLPVLLMICAELLCGGVFGVAMSVALFLGAMALLSFSSKRLMRAVRNKVKDPALQMTPESIVVQNARYILTARSEGMTDDSIRLALFDVGWTKEDVDAAFARADLGPDGLY